MDQSATTASSGFPDTANAFPHEDNSALFASATPAQDSSIPASGSLGGTNTGTDSVSATVSTSSSGGGRRRSVLMIGIAVLLMTAGVIAGTFALTRQSFDRAVAWDCTLYKFAVTETGAVTVQNGSSRSLPSQLATVYIDEQQVAEFEVPALDAGSSASLGVVPVPEDGKFAWRVTGNKDCENTESFLPSEVAQCINIKAFDENWDPLTPEDLATFEPGDTVRFSVAGETNIGSFEAARFTINDELREPVTTLRPGTSEFYDEFEIPEDVAQFSVTVELLHSEAGWF